MAEQTQNVDVRCTAYNSMAVKWDLLHDLLGGTRAMRDAGVKWLPKEADEDMKNYKARLGRSILFGGYADTIEKLAGKPFTKPITLQGALPDQLSGLCDDVDGTGFNLTQFGKDAFRSGAKYGLAHILVDYPRVPQGVDLKTERDMRPRPTFVLVEPPQLIGWRTESIAGGQPRLTSIRILEQATVPDGLYGDKVVTRIRVYNVDSWELWEQDGKDWKPIDGGNHTFGGIPLVTCYFLRSGFMVGEPPLEDLAWLNLAHWQSMSDQRNILRFARFGLLFAKGFSNQEVESGLTVGPSRLISTTSENADLKYVEHNGAAIESGEKDLTKLEERMEVLGMQPLIRQSGDVKATGQAINESKSQSEIQAWIRNLEGALLTAYQLAAKWIGVKIPSDFKVDIFSDFAVAFEGSSDLQQLLLARQAGELSRQTYLREIKRRGLLSEGVDVDKEIDAIGQEGPSLADME